MEKKLPQTYDTAWYRGNTFNPTARGNPEPLSSVKLTPKDEEEPGKFRPPPPSEDDILSEFFGVPNEAERERRRMAYAGGRMKASQQAADRFLEAHGHWLKPRRGGSVLKGPKSPDEE